MTPLARIERLSAALLEEMALIPREETPEAALDALIDAYDALRRARTVLAGQQ